MLKLLSLLVVLSTPALAQTVKSLDQIPGALKTPEAKEVFATQMQGKPEPDGLGLKLPATLDATTLTKLLVPASDTATLNAVGAKALPGQADIFVALVCTGGDIPVRDTDTRCERTRDDKQALRVHLGLVEAKAGAAPRLLATPLEIDGRIDWRKSGLPSAPDALDETADGMILPDRFERFDLAAYRIAPDIRAFGLRGAWFDGYAGGMGVHRALYLFAPIDGALRQVWAAPMSAYKDLAGDWNKDGTRQHHVTDGAKVLSVAATRTDGYFDLVVKRRNGKGAQTYKWSPASGSYRPAGK
jgi:hypothetical protein